MKRYSNPYLKTLRRRTFRSPIWLDSLLLTMLVAIIALYPFPGDLERIDVYSYQDEPIASSSQQILTKTGVVEPDQDAELTLHATGVASWYNYGLDGDEVGQEWSKSHDTCATRGWNRYGRAKVTNLANDKSVTCYINDNGPRDCEYRYKYKLDAPGECIERVIDLSSHAFAQIADLGSGLINVKVELVSEFSPSNK